ncbi:MAG: hypothetical protein IPK59_19625 [Rhodospirillaceae bacterium]|nr:hypothetical protein [Rhodospirillaceae bacterium]
MALLPQFLEELRRRVSIFDVVGRRVRLNRRGLQATGLCPFHNEKSPSFHVYEGPDEPPTTASAAAPMAMSSPS